MDLKVATYNIHSCIGTDSRFDPARTAEVIKELDADIIALQEVDYTSFEGRDLLNYLARKTCHVPIEGPTLTRETGHYGNGILTRLPIREVTQIELSADRREPRGAIDAILDWNGQTLHVVATHLGLWPSERRRQVVTLIDCFDRKPQGNLLLLGDLNEWLLWGRPLRRLHRYFSPTPHRRTFPSRFPLFSLDQIWSRPAAALTNVQVHATRTALLASDHLPLKGILRATPTV